MQDSDTIQRMTVEWTRAQPSVSRFIRSFVRDRAQADDLLQEARFRWSLILLGEFVVFHSRAEKGTTVP